MSLPLSSSTKPKDSDCSSVDCCQAEQAVKALAAVRKILDDKDTPEDISMDELFLKAGVSSNIPVWIEDMLHWKQCCHAKKTIRIMDKHL